MKKGIVVMVSTFLLVFALFPNNIANASPVVCFRKGLNNTVCLTIDDGYGRADIEKILDVLKANHVNCTFFIVGAALKQNKDLWHRAIADGNQICYHTMHHTILSILSNAQIQSDINQWNRTLSEALPGYVSPRLARFPGGDGEKSPRLLALFARNGYRVVGWSVDLHVGIKRDPNHIIARHIEKLCKVNSIILIHFTMYNANALPYYICWLKSNFILSTVTEAICSKGEETHGSYRYTTE